MEFEILLEIRVSKITLMIYDSISKMVSHLGRTVVLPGLYLVINVDYRVVSRARHPSFGD